MAHDQSGERQDGNDRIEDRIRDLDAQLLKLLAQRVELVREGMHAARQQVPDDSAEGAGYAQLVSTTPGGRSASQSTRLDGPGLDAVFREVHSLCVAAVQPIKVVYLGPEYSYSHQAALQQFGHSFTLLPVTTIAAVFEEVSRGQADFGLVPVENSTDGRIADTLEMFCKVRVQICGEVQLRIHHCLWGQGTIKDIRKVCSKPQALSQCRNWLAQHLPDVENAAASSTAAAAQVAAQDPCVAAVAGRHAGAAHGLNLLAENIEDRPDNVTRFAVIGRQATPRSGQDKTSLMFELPHRPGALADAMVIFKKNRLNLTWIESFPKPGSAKEYLFFVEFLGHSAEMRVRRATRDLERKAVRVDILGSYPVSVPID